MCLMAKDGDGARKQASLIKEQHRDATSLGDCTSDFKKKAENPFLATSFLLDEVRLSPI